MKQKLVFTSGILPCEKYYVSFAIITSLAGGILFPLFFCKKYMAFLSYSIVVPSFFTACLVLSVMCHSPFFFDNLVVDDKLVHIAMHFTPSLMSEETNSFWIEHAVVG